MLRKRLTVLLLAAVLLTAPHVAHGSDAPTRPLTPHALQAEWDRVLQVAPALRAVSVTLGIEPENGRYRGITTCRDYPQCTRLYVGIVGNTPYWWRVLWHEAGHALHWKLHWLKEAQFAGFSALLLEQELDDRIWEVWAESFRKCFSPEEPPALPYLAPRCAYIGQFTGSAVAQSGGGGHILRT